MLACINNAPTVTDCNCPDASLGWYSQCPHFYVPVGPETAWAVRVAVGEYEESDSRELYEIWSFTMSECVDKEQARMKTTHFEIAVREEEEEKRLKINRSNFLSDCRAGYTVACHFCADPDALLRCMHIAISVIVSSSKYLVHNDLQESCLEITNVQTSFSASYWMSMLIHEIKSSSRLFHCVMKDRSWWKVTPRFRAERSEAKEILSSVMMWFSLSQRSLRPRRKFEVIQDYFLLSAMMSSKSSTGSSGIVELVQ